MYKLVSNIKGSKWSFMNGCNIFNMQTVWLSKKEDARKYSLLDENDNKLDAKVEDFLVEEKF